MADTSKDVRKFTTDISLYDKGRPEYSKESVEFLLNTVGVLPSNSKESTKLLEIAAGTGKFTRVMVEVLTTKKAKVEIIASDSQEAMCDVFRRCVPGIEVRHFPAEKIGKRKQKQRCQPLEIDFLCCANPTIIDPPLTPKKSRPLPQPKIDPGLPNRLSGSGNLNKTGAFFSWTLIIG